MKLILVLVVCVLASGSRVSAEPIAVKVLYAGNPGSDREKEFVELLEKHFANVGKTALSKFTPKDAADFDVVILDWTTILARNPDGTMDEKNPRINMPPIPKLDETYTRPTVLIGSVAGHFGDKHKLKINWLCLCLNDAAHEINARHEVFQRPLKVDLSTIDRPTPENYRHFPEGNDLPATMKVVLMQSKTYPQIDPGLVSDPYRFETDPDAEIMSGGLNMKGPASVAIGRHGNYLQWGFSASPKDMTDPAKACFVNCVAYIRKFDGQAPVVKVVDRGRGQTVVIAEHIQQNPQRLKAEECFSSGLLKDAGSKNLADYLRDNVEYIYGEDNLYALDADAKAMKLSNRKVEILERAVSMLETKSDDEVAKRLLKRYTKKSFETPAQWRAWLNESKDRLFFTDAGGYCWTERPAAKPVAAAN